MKTNCELSSPELKKQATALLAEFEYDLEDGMKTVDRPSYLGLTDTFGQTPHISWL